MAITPDMPQTDEQTNSNDQDQSSTAPPSKWRRLGWFVGLWAVSVFVLWVISWIIRWAVA